MSLGCLMLEASTHQAVYENAGHPYPFRFIRSESVVKQIEIPGSPLGVRKKLPKNKVDFSFMPGDAVLLYSDGIYEALNPHGECYGLIRLEQLFKDCMNSSLSLDDSLERIFASLDSFRKPGPFDDDLTLMIIRRRDETRQNSPMPGKPEKQTSPLSNIS